jgi:DNA-3-methyladenine glycosylase
MDQLPVDSSSMPSSSEACAQWLLGKVLVRKQPIGGADSDGTLAGLIIETEAYPPGDPASHAFKGQNRRNASMFLPAGYWYVYLIYGIHYCINLVTGEEGSGEAVLIRALYPFYGLNQMSGNRGEPKTRRNLCSGPGKLCQALAIDGSHNSLPAFYTPDAPGEPTKLYLAEAPMETGELLESRRIIRDVRIGISKNSGYLGRFFYDWPEYVSISKLDR